MGQQSRRGSECPVRFAAKCSELTLSTKQEQAGERRFSNLCASLEYARRTTLSVSQSIRNIPLSGLRMADDRSVSNGRKSAVVRGLQRSRVPWLATLGDSQGL